MSYQRFNPFEHQPQLGADPIKVAERLMPGAGGIMKRARQREGLVAMTEDELLPLASAFSQEEHDLIKARELLPTEFWIDCSVFAGGELKQEILETSGFTQMSFLEILNKPASAFELTDDVLNQIGINDTELRSLLTHLDQEKKEVAVACLVEAKELIEKKQQANPGVEVYDISTKDVLEMMDVRGYRPATAEELLAYAVNSWKGIQEHSCTPEQLNRLKEFQYIVALGSCADRQEMGVVAATLIGEPGIYALSSEPIDRGWYEFHQFLFIQK